MNDRRLRIASEQLAALNNSAEWHPDAVERGPFHWALMQADALIAAAGEQETREPRQGEIDRHMLGQALDAALARAEAAEARASALQSKLDASARLARETAGEVAMLMRRMEPLTRDELINDGAARNNWLGMTVTEALSLVNHADRIRARRVE